VVKIIGKTTKLTYDYVREVIEAKNCRLLAERNIKLVRIPYYKFNKINEELADVVVGNKIC
jgi:hypothetical protein